MGRPRAVRRFTLNAVQLDGLATWCASLQRNAALANNLDPSMVVRCAVMATLIEQARFGIGLAKINAQKPEVRSIAGKKAARARWDRVWAQRRASAQNKSPAKFDDETA